MKNLRAKDIMSTNVLTVPESMTVIELASFFTEKMISGAPVVDHDGNLVGVVSLSDIVRTEGRRSAIVKEQHEADYYLHGWENRLNEDELQEFHLEDDDGLTVRDIMTPLIFKVSEDTPITEMADIMIGGRIHRLIVTRDEKVVGIVSTLDMLKALRDRS